VQCDGGIGPQIHRRPHHRATAQRSSSHPNLVRIVCMRLPGVRRCFLSRGDCPVRFGESGVANQHYLCPVRWRSLIPCTMERSGSCQLPGVGRGLGLPQPFLTSCDRCHAFGSPTMELAIQLRIQSPLISMRHHMQRSSYLVTSYVAAARPDGFGSPDNTWLSISAAGKHHHQQTASLRATAQNAIQRTLSKCIPWNRRLALACSALVLQRRITFGYYGMAEAMPFFVSNCRPMV
jgi:hypothetical protein